MWWDRARELCECGVVADWSGHKKKRGNVVLIDAVSALLFKMGWLTRLELVTRGTTIRCSTY